MSKILKIDYSAMWIRESNTFESETIDIVYSGETYKILQTKGDWALIDKGWIYLNNELNTVTDENTLNVSSIKNPNKKLTRDSISEKDGEMNYTVDTSSNNSRYGSNGTQKNMILNCRGIHGMPYQFMPNADIRLTNSKFGRKYAEKVITRLPVLLINPGRPKFMKDFSSSAKKNILTYLATKDKSVSLDDLLGNNKGKIYSFEYAYADYYKYVNPMLRRMANYLGLSSIKLDNTRLDSYNWENYANDSFKSFMSKKETVAFFVDSETQIQETFSNSTTNSLLENGINTASDIGRELSFMLGGGAGLTFESIKEDDGTFNMDSFNNWVDKYASVLPKRLTENLKQGVTTVLNGGKMVFPEIWSESNFSRNYQISMKLAIPDADNLSWFMGIGVPLAHLICLTAPQQLGANGYKSPFIVRGYYKGFFNCDMGIITDLSISKGDKAKWTLDGLPTVVDISFSIKDLYQIMFISKESKLSSELLANNTYLDYIANLCGINVSKPDLERAIDLTYMTIKNDVKRLITVDGFIGVQNTLSNIVNNIFKN